MLLLAGESASLICDISVIDGEKCLLVQSDAKSLQLWYGTTSSRRIDVGNTMHAVFLVDGVIDHFRNRVISIGCDHVDILSDEMNGPGSVKSMDLSGKPLGDTFRFPDKPTDIARDAFCQYVAVTTHRGGIHLFNNTLSGLEHSWVVDPRVGPYPSVSVSRDGRYVATAGCFGICCLRRLDGSMLMRREASDQVTYACFVGNEYLCCIVDNTLSVIGLSELSNNARTVHIDGQVIGLCQSSCGHGVVVLLADGPRDPSKRGVGKVTYIDLRASSIIEQAAKPTGQ